MRWETQNTGPYYDDVERLAEKLHSADMGPPYPYSPWGQRPRLSDLWPVDQERYRRLALAALAARSE